MSFNWIERAAHKRRAQFSNVIVFETSDPERIRALEQLIFTSSFFDIFNLKDKSKKPLQLTRLVYDPWEGLRKIEQTAQEGILNISTTPFKPSKQEDSVFGAFAGAGTALEPALRDAEAEMKAHTTVLLIKNIAQREQPLLQAIRSWVVNDELYLSKSTVFIFAESAGLILDDYTKKSAAVIPIPISTPEEREKIIKDSSEKFPGITFNPHLIQVSAGLNLHDTEAALYEGFYKERNFTPQHLTDFKTEIVKKTGILTFETPKFGFEGIGGYPSTKDFINDEVLALLKNPDACKRMGLEPPKGILLFGPPGTGKTIFGEAIAYTLQLPFITLRLEDLLQGVVGATEQKTRQAIDLIEEISPAIVFIDEVDKLGKRSDVSTDSGVRRNLFSTLLSWLAAPRKSIVIATTNVPDQLDDAFIRAGRFDAKIPVMFPDADARAEILRIHLNVRRVVPNDIRDFTPVVEKTNLFSGAELEELTKRAARHAFKEGAESVTLNHLLDALSSFNINAKARREQLDKYIRLAETFCDDKQYLSKVNTESREVYDRAKAVSEELTA